MKIKHKGKTVNANNRVSALARLSKPMTMNRNNKTSNHVHRRLNAPTTSMIADARQLLNSRSNPIFDARQLLLGRQSSKTFHVSDIGPADFMQTEKPHDADEYMFESKTNFANSRFIGEARNISFDNKINTFITVQNPDAAESASFTKTITNKVLHGEDDDHDQSLMNSNQLSSLDRKFNISFVNDQYQQRPKSPSPPASSPLPTIRRLQDASIQTAYSPSSSRSSNRTDSRRRNSDEHSDAHEPFIKRSSSRTTTREKEKETVKQSQSTVSNNSLKRSSIDTPSAKRSSTHSAIKSYTDKTTILITNLQSTVTEDDIYELFSDVGHIEEIITLSRGCIQILYSKEEHAVEAVEKYHNQILDGQQIYVSLQPSFSDSSKSSKTSSSSRHSDSKRTKNHNSSFSISESESSKVKSNKIIIDPTFMRQALFYPSNNKGNPVQFQVKV